MLASLPSSEESEADFSLQTGDAFLRLDQVADETIQLVITSPPYNVGKEYERENSMSLDEYLAWLEPIVKKLCSKIRDSGSVCWQVGNFVKDGEVFPLDYFFYKMFVGQGFKLRNRIIWQFNFGLHASKRLSGRYETLLWFTKSDNYTFNLDPIRIPQLYPGKRHSKRKGERAGQISGNPLGKNPSDVWTFSGDEFFNNNPVWQIPNVKANHPEKTAHPCQFPHELVERCVLAFSNMGDIVLDPFVGTGTSVIAALKSGRNAIGIDKSADYIAIAQSRIVALRHGNLPLRKSGTIVKKPDLRNSVARIPNEWLQAAE
jgi:adenine-specific DNA-methyltransferase